MTKNVRLPRLVILQCVFVAANVFGDEEQIYWPTDYARVVTKWQEIVPEKNPPPGISNTEKVPFWDLHWHVYVENGEVVGESTPEGIKRHESLPPFKPIMADREPAFSDNWVAGPVADGWIVAFNFGEWGAAIYWFSSDGSRQYHISSGLISGFLAGTDGLFATADLKMDFDKGSLAFVTFECSGPEKRWRVKTLSDVRVSGAPIARLRSGAFLCLADKKLLAYLPGTAANEISAEKIILGDYKLFNNGAFVVSGGKLYAGKSWLVEEMDLRDFHVRYLVPDSRFVSNFLRWSVSHEAKDNSSP